MLLLGISTVANWQSSLTCTGRPSELAPLSRSRASSIWLTYHAHFAFIWFQPFPVSAMTTPSSNLQVASPSKNRAINPARGVLTWIVPDTNEDTNLAKEQTRTTVNLSPCCLGCCLVVELHFQFAWFPGVCSRNKWSGDT